MTCTCVEREINVHACTHVPGISLLYCTVVCAPGKNRLETVQARLSYTTINFQDLNSSVLKCVSWKMSSVLTIVTGAH